MKKSNRVFIALIATLYIVPALTFGAAQFTSEKCLTGFTQKFQIIQIDNPVSGARGAGQDKNLTLHIRINNIQKIRLNGEEIWTR